jgi:hypothetical protein
MFRITDENGEFFFKYPSSIKIAEDGSIFLTDDSQFLKFTSDGKFLKNIKKKGQGPGEIQSPFFYYHLQDENIFIYDPMNIKIIFMDQEGKLIEEFRLKERYHEFIGLREDNFIFTKYIWPDIEERTGKVFNIPSKILFISREGNIINECSGIPEKMFLHPKLAARFPQKKYENDIVFLYNFKGNLWVRTSTDDDKKGTLYDVFNRVGQYIDSFWLEVGESLITTHGDCLFIRERDEDFNISIVKYRVLE